MGQDFRRDDEELPANAFLNYGYTVLRAAAARAVVGAGLIPQIGLMHRGSRDSFALADDLMEPYRPAVDRLALDLVSKKTVRLDPDAKRALARILLLDVQTPRGRSTLTEALHQTALSLVESFTSKRPTLWLPDPLASFSTSAATA